MTQLGERRVPGAEIVERDADAMFPELPKQLDALTANLHDGILGHLEAELSRVVPRVLQELHDA